MMGRTSRPRWWRIAGTTLVMTMMVTAVMTVVVVGRIRKHMRRSLVYRRPATMMVMVVISP